MKLAKQLSESLAVFNGEPNLIAPDNSNEDSGNYYIQNIFNGLLHTVDDNLDCLLVEVSEGQVDVYITDGVKTSVLSFFDEDGVPFMTVSDYNEEQPDEDEGETEAFDLSDLGIFDGQFDFAKLDKRILDYFTDLSEAFLTVIRGGKKVKKKLKRIKRKKPLTGKRKAGVRRAVMKRKRTARVALRKRKKSLAIRKRSHLKHKPKKFKV